MSPNQPLAAETVWRSDAAGGKEVGREAYFPPRPRVLARSSRTDLSPSCSPVMIVSIRCCESNPAIEFREASPAPIDQLRRVTVSGGCRTVVLGSGPNTDECSIELARTRNVARWRPPLRVVDVVWRP